MKKCTVMLLVLALLITELTFKSAVADETEELLGKPMPDFSVITISGDRFTLSEALKSKKAVLVNFWATWCGPCVSEFPYMEQAYQLYKDDVAIIALSVETNDTAEVMKEFAKEWNLSFPIANDAEVGMSELYAAGGGIPTSVLVDRFGNVVFIELGAQMRLDAFTNAFDLLISDTYTQTVLMSGFPGSKSDKEPADDTLLAAAVGNPPFHVTSSDNPFAWPFLPARYEDRNCLAASNVGRFSTYSEVIVEIDAHAGDVFTFDAALDTQAFYEKLVIRQDGEKLRTFSGKTNWFTYAVELKEGRNVISLIYDKSIEYFTTELNSGEGVFLNSFRLLRDEEGAKALAGNPVFNFADKTELTVTNESAREVKFTSSDGNDTIQQLYGPNTRAYIVNDIVMRCQARISDEYDPDDIFVDENCTGMLFTAYMFQNKTLAIPLNSVQDTGLCSTLVLMYDTLDRRIANLLLLENEDSADEMCRRLKNRDIECSWSYADISAEAGQENLPESVDYTVIFTDQNGEPVPGCIINFCTDEICTPVKADKNGIASFTGAPYEYHLQVIKVPSGYSFDTAQGFTAPLLGGELSFTVLKQ